MLAPLTDSPIQYHRVAACKSMEEFRLETFADGSLIDDLVVGPGSLSIRLVGVHHCRPHRIFNPE